MKTRILATKTGIRMSSFIGLVFIIVTLAIPSSNLAQETKTPGYEVDCSIPAGFGKSRPDPIGTPTQVQMGVFFVDIIAINDAKQTYNAHFFLFASWNDTRLSETSLGRSLEDCQIKMSEIWHPDLVGLNRVGGKKLLEDVVDIDRNGMVRYRQRYRVELFSDRVGYKA